MDVTAAQRQYPSQALSLAKMGEGDSNESNLGPKECDSSDSANLTAMVK